MKAIASFDGRVLVTGAAGFIGSALCRELGEGLSLGSAAVLPVDVADGRELADALGGHSPETVIHLAARGAALTPIEKVGELLDTAVTGSINLLQSLRPRHLIFASSCAVYGNTSRQGVACCWHNVRPMSVYGYSKATVERILAHWAYEQNRSVTILRFGNVVGRGCRGLIDYLVRHAAEQGQSAPARLRGAGRITRDYVPVQHVLRSIVSAMRMPSPQGRFRTFNVGTGRGLTNRQVAEIVQGVLRDHGIPLSIHWQPLPGPGEPWTAVLDSAKLERAFGLQPPSEHESFSAISEAAHCAIQRTWSNMTAPQMLGSAAHD